MGNNPVNYVDPTGHRSQRITVDGKAKTIHISWNVLFGGDGATAEVIERIIKSIKAQWQDDYDGFKLTIDITSDKSKQYDTITVHKTNPNGESSRVIDRRDGHFYLVDENGDPDDLTWTAAHEFGHFMGLGDRYGDQVVNGKRVSGADPGWSGNIMAQVGGAVQKRNIVEMIRNNIHWPNRRVTIKNPTEEWKQWLRRG